MIQNTLPHAERLRTLGAIRRMFDNGQSGFIYPFRYVWYAETDEVGSVEVLFSVPKKFHKRANKRNLLRRRTKEAYRLRKQQLYNAAGSANIDLGLIYSTKEVLPYKTIENALRKILEQIAERL
ncbi:MAG: ribonuclease P protein component [Alistipes sp.]